MEEITREKHLVLELAKQNKELRKQIEDGTVDPLFTQAGFLNELIRVSRLKTKRFDDQVRFLSFFSRIYSNNFILLLVEDDCHVYLYNWRPATL